MSEKVPLRDVTVDPEEVWKITQVVLLCGRLCNNCVVLCGGCATLCAACYPPRCLHSRLTKVRGVGKFELMRVTLLGNNSDGAGWGEVG